MSPAPDDSLTCPVPPTAPDCVLLAHGEGARLTRRLIRQLLLEAFDNEYLRPLGDGAVLAPLEGRPVLSTDSFVVSPLFFPGGDIGQLAIHGTINDLAVCGAEPLYLTVGLIVEEGLPLDTLRRVVQSMRGAAQSCSVAVVTGDTKVVPRGAADKLFINTTGLGRLPAGVSLGSQRVRPGDRILVSGHIGDHGMAILAAREGLEFASAPRSDTASIYVLVQALFAAGIDVHFLRDPTRGGVSAVLHEVAEQAELTMVVDEEKLPLSAEVRGACEILGLDPLYVANEGKLVAMVAKDDAERALACWRRLPLGQQATIIGAVEAKGHSPVLVRSLLGSRRVLDEPSGAPLPRIC